LGIEQKNTGTYQHDLIGKTTDYILIPQQSCTIQQNKEKHGFKKPNDLARSKCKHGFKQQKNTFEIHD